VTCPHRSPGGHLTCSRTADHDPAGRGGHTYTHPSSAPDAKAYADQHCEDVER
jgi:hypothetical protein